MYYLRLASNYIRGNQAEELAVSGYAPIAIQCKEDLLKPIDFQLEESCTVKTVYLTENDNIVYSHILNLHCTAPERLTAKFSLEFITMYNLSFGDPEIEAVVEDVF